jgi:hypothetical protein
VNRRSSAVALVLACAAVSGLAACGSSAKSNGEASKSAAQVLTDTKNALLQSSSVHVKGTLTESGKAETIDFSAVGADTNVTLTGAGTNLHLIKAGSQIYVNAPAAFWTQNGVGAQASKVAGKWIKVPSSQVSDQSQITLQGLAASFNATDSPLKSQVTKSKLDGKSVVVLEQANGSKLSVAATGKPVPLQIVNNGSSKGTLTFDGYGKQPSVKAPAGALSVQQALSGASTGAPS